MQYSIGTTFYVTPKETIEVLFKIAEEVGILNVKKELNGIGFISNEEMLLKFKSSVQENLNSKQNPPLSVTIYDESGCVGIIRKKLT